MWLAPAEAYAISAALSMTRRFTGDPSLDAQIEREIRYGSTRWAEVWLAAIMVGVGLGLLEPTSVFGQPTWRLISARVSEDVAGWISLLTGLVRLTVLYLNGNHRFTRDRGPLIRCVACIGGGLFFGALALGFALVGSQEPSGVLKYIFAVLALAEVHASGRAAQDMFAADSLGLRARGRKNADSRGP